MITMMIVVVFVVVLFCVGMLPLHCLSSRQLLMKTTTMTMTMNKIEIASCVLVVRAIPDEPEEHSSSSTLLVVVVVAVGSWTTT